MHAVQRERLILEALKLANIVRYPELEALLNVPRDTIRRDLIRLEERNLIARVHGGAKVPEVVSSMNLDGTPLERSIPKNLAAKKAIGRTAAALCEPGEAIMLDGGTTTLQMCSHLKDLSLSVLTNSLLIVEALLPQPDTRILLPSGTLFREQNIILAPSGWDYMPRFHTPKLFMGAAAVGPQGVMQQDVILVASKRRFIDRAEEVVLLVDSSKFVQSSGAIVCGLNEVDVLVTDAGIGAEVRNMLEMAGVRLIVTSNSSPS